MRAAKHIEEEMFPFLPALLEQVDRDGSFSLKHLTLLLRYVTGRDRDTCSAMSRMFMNVLIKAVGDPNGGLYLDGICRIRHVPETRTYYIQEPPVRKKNKIRTKFNLRFKKYIAEEAAVNA